MSDSKTEKENSRHSETRQAILAHALEVFAEKGFDGATTRDIAARADVNHAMINYYFTNKEELWKQAVDLLFERLNAAIKMTDEDFEKLHENPRAFLKEFFRRYIKYCAQYPEHARIMIQESVRDSERLTWAVKKHIRAGHAEAGALIRIGIEWGIFPNVSPMAFGYMLVGASQLIYALAPEAKHIYGRNVFDEQAIEEHVEAFTAIFFRDEERDAEKKSDTDGKAIA